MVRAHMALALQGVTLGQFFKEKKSKEHIYVLTACQVKALTPQTQPHKMLSMHFPKVNQTTDAPARKECKRQLHLQNTSVQLGSGSCRNGLRFGRTSGVCSLLGWCSRCRISWCLFTGLNTEGNQRKCQASYVLRKLGDQWDSFPVKLLEEPEKGKINSSVN